jgi:lipopolysaccharide transport system ATP-binding protein
MDDTVVKVKNLSKRYHLGRLHGQTHSFREKVSGVFKKRVMTEKRGIIWALKDVSFEVKKGEILGIIGRNGAGKSTLLKILSRITRPTSGKAFINGRVGSLLEVGTGFHSELTGRENIFLNGSILGMKKAEIKKKFDEIVAFAEVDKFIDTPVKRYSSGMYVRLAFAVAAHLEPDILLVDEVLAVGDLAFQKKCLGKMEEVGNKGRTVIFISHNLQLINQLCQRSLLLNRGSLIANDRTSVVIDTYNETMTSAVAVRDLTNPDLRSPNSLKSSLFKWTYIKILNSKKEVSSEIRFGEPFELIISGSAVQKCKNIRVGFGIINKLAGVVFNSHHFFEKPSDVLQEGPSKLRIEINPNILAPGYYSINIGAVGYQVTDRLLNCFGFRIMEIGIKSDKIWDPTYKRGVIDFPWCKWRITRD